MSFATLRQSPTLRPGEQAIAYGFPLRGSLAKEGNLTIGNVSALRGLNDDPDNIQISTPVQPGNSGGPLLDSSGNVIGVVASKLDALNALARNGDLPQNVNFAINLSVLKDFLARGGLRATEATSRFQLRPDEVGDRAKAFTYSVECDPSSNQISPKTVSGDLLPEWMTGAGVIGNPKDRLNNRPSGSVAGGIILNIEGEKVRVDDGFLRLSPEQQNARIDEIAKSLNIKVQPKNPINLQTRAITLKKGQTLSSILRDVGASSADAVSIATALRPYDDGPGLREGDVLRIRPQRPHVVVIRDKVIRAAAELSDLGQWVAVDLKTIALVAE